MARAASLITQSKQENIMRALVIEALGGEPIVEEFADPAGEDVAQVLAAPLNPVDLTIATGQMPLRQVSPPFVAGMEGIARLADGTVRYFAGPRLPYGSVAERVPLAGADTAAVPPGLDPTLAAALGVSGLAAWLSLSSTGRLAQGESVLVLGAEGQVGQVATQVARLLGASRVVGAVHDDQGRQVALDAGADAAVSTADVDTLSDRLRAAAPDGVDLILDMVLGAGHRPRHRRGSPAGSGRSGRQCRRCAGNCVGAGFPQQAGEHPAALELRLLCR